jgi:hypothetical protein
MMKADAARRQLGGQCLCSRAPGFVVSEAEAAAIRAIFEQGGDLSAAVELHRLFPASPTLRRRETAPGPIAAWQPRSVPLRAAVVGAMAEGLMRSVACVVGIVGPPASLFFDFLDDLPGLSRRSGSRVPS